MEGGIPADDCHENVHGTQHKKESTVYKYQDVQVLVSSDERLSASQ